MIPGLGRQKQMNLTEFKASLVQGYIEKPRLEKLKAGGGGRWSRKQSPVLKLFSALYDTKRTPTSFMYISRNKYQPECSF